MVSVARNARGRAQVSTDRQRFMVDAFLVFRELVGRDLVFFHALRVRVATRAGSRNVEGIHGGPRIVWWPDIVHGMAIHADRDFSIAGGQPFPVNTGVILAELVRTKAWVVFAHDRGIGMAASA